MKFQDQLSDNQRKRIGFNLRARVGKEQIEKVVEIMNYLTSRASIMLNEIRQKTN